MGASHRDEQDGTNVTKAEQERDPLVGKVLGGRYRLDTLLGSGGVGRVYAAEHVMMRKPLAVKVLHAEHAKNPEVVARFEREATAAANIDHPNVVAAMDFGKLDDGTVYLALELVQGKNLRAEIARGPFGVRRALHVARQIALGLAAAHGRNIVHRDLKPENVVLVEKDGDPDVVKVLDFGVAKLTDDASALTKVGVVLGTMDYMAPEQALGKSVDGRADLYALGAVLYEMLSGARPFEGESASAILQLQLTKPAPSLAERAPTLGIPKGVDALVMKLLAKDPNDRPAFAAAIAAQLAELMASSPEAATPGSAVVGKPAPAGVPRPQRPTYLPTDPLPQFTFPPTVEGSKKLVEEVQAALATQATVPPPVPVALPAPVPPPERPASAGDAPPGAVKLERIAVEPVQNVQGRAAAVLDLVAAWVEDHLRYLPRVIRRPLRRVPSSVLAAVLLGAGVVLFIALVVWLA
jgi:serine/threonine protein kinase